MPLKTHIDEQPALNLTPMIDIVFLLIIFFMVGTKFTEMERKIPVSVPQVSNAGALSPAPERRVVNVFRDGKVTLDDQQRSLEQLTEELTDARSQYPQLGVLIRGDAEVAFQNVASVFSACQSAGFSEMAISVRLTSGRTASGGQMR